MRYSFQLIIVLQFTTLIQAFLVDETTEPLLGLSGRPIVKIEGFWRLHESKIIQRGTETSLTTHRCTSASKVEPR